MAEVVDLTPRVGRDRKAWTTQPQYVYRRQWRPDDPLILDNTGASRRLTPYEVDSGGELRRVTRRGGGRGQSRDHLPLD